MIIPPFDVISQAILHFLIRSFWPHQDCLLRYHELAAAGELDAWRHLSRPAAPKKTRNMHARWPLARGAQRTTSRGIRYPSPGWGEAHIVGQIQWELAFRRVGCPCLQQGTPTAQASRRCQRTVSQKTTADESRFRSNWHYATQPRHARE